MSYIDNNKTGGEERRSAYGNMKNKRMAETKGGGGVIWRRLGVNQPAGANNRNNVEEGRRRKRAA
jgi:hypothetical protein